MEIIKDILCNTQFFKNIHNSRWYANIVFCFLENETVNDTAITFNDRNKYRVHFYNFFSRAKERICKRLFIQKINLAVDRQCL